MTVIDLGAFRAAKQKCEETSEASGEKYTLSGAAVCAACKYEWMAEKIDAPIVHFECPSCHSHRAVFKGPVTLPENSLVCTCTFCGGQLYMMTTEGHFCVGCGGYFCWDGLPQPA